MTIKSIWLLVVVHLKTIVGAMNSLVPNSGSRLDSSFKKSSGIGTSRPLIEFNVSRAWLRSVDCRPGIVYKIEDWIIIIDIDVSRYC